MSPSSPSPFRDAARAYFVYGVVYWIGGAFLAWHGVGTRSGGRVVGAGIAWVALGLVFVFLIPYLLARPRRWFERWILSRRDFARILAVLMAFRAWKVLQVARRHETAIVPAPWGGEIAFATGASVFFVVTVGALAFVARAAWTASRGAAEPGPGDRGEASP